MTSTPRNKMAAVLIVSLCTVPLLAACGGGAGVAIDFGDLLGQLGTTGGNDSGSPNCDLVVLVVTAGYICQDSSGSPPPAATPPGSGDSAGSGGTGASRINYFAEYEPNNVLDNANPLQFPAVSGDTPAGIEVSGRVQDDADPADFFIFTPRRSGSHAVYLCTVACAERIIDDAVYLMVYDQSQTTIASTPIATVGEQALAVPMTAGLAYYVEVHGYNTASMPYDYSLVVSE